MTVRASSVALACCQVSFLLSQSADPETPNQLLGRFNSGVFKGLRLQGWLDGAAFGLPDWQHPPDPVASRSNS